ncbi:amidohydrolase family protein [Planococcus glaciei]|uniref:amidohydrolase family protein n=1 Tax=Planococcus glaciei TaxID=459472 RepID=UPI001C73221C|nr:amidohydrolase family protein [Planococcus glaciei]MBX0315298.1 amidohydrolase family protein [Planococcus glaciei]
MIDIHSHPMHIKELVDQDPDLGRYVKSVYGVQSHPHSLESHIYQLDVAGIDQAVIMPIDCTTAHGCTLVKNEQIAWLMEENPRFIGFASIDPRNPGATRQLEKAVKEYGLRGLKLDPSLQQFNVQDEDHAYPVYQLCSELNIPILFHSGMSWSPLGLADLSNPIKFEKIIQAFPNLKIIISQFGWPWVNEAFMLAIKYKNVFLETSILFSGTPSDSVRQVLEQQIGIENLSRSLAGQIVFGSNTPRVDPKRLVWAIKDLGLDPALEKKILHSNAETLLTQTGRVKHEVHT